MTKSFDRKNLLFLNPPAPVPVIRDYYCSKTSRTNHLFPPIDFIMQSGALCLEYDLHFIDAVRDKLTETGTIEAIEIIDPQVVFFLAGAVNHPSDIEFVAKLHKPDRIFIGTGDIFISEPKTWLEKFPFISAIPLDFTNNDILCYLKGEHHLIQRMAYRTDPGNIVEACHSVPSKTIDLPVPRHDLFLDKRYRFPFSRHHKFSVILTDFGCPYKCSFCVMASLPYRCRAKDMIIDELNRLHKLEIREFFWVNQTFGIKKNQSVEILKQMEKFSPLFSWTAFSRPDVVDETLIAGMKKAGCHTIILGVESGSEEILERYKKDYTLDQVKDAFALCRRHRIRTVGTFILGLPEETEETVRQTISLSRKIGCDFASFHVAVPRSNTDLRKEAIKTGRISREDYSMDQSGSYISFVPKGMDRSALIRLKKKAVLGFYLRPGYLLRQLLSIRNIYEGFNMILQALFLIINNDGNKPVQKKEHKTK